LPAEFKALAQKFPEIKNLFKDVGIRDEADLSKLVGTEINIPSLAKSLGILPGSLLVDGTGKIIDSRISQLPGFLKAKIPSEVIFARGVNQLVDFNTFISLSKDGRPIQKLRTISGKKLHLSVKPEYAVKSVKGYMTFVSREKSAKADKNNLLTKILKEFNLVDRATASNNPTLSKFEQKLVLDEFYYTDKDGDGVYTADVYVPVPEGEYEVLTVIEYKDNDYGTKLVRLTTIVDPEGYVYEKIKGKELRISSALVSLHWLNTKTKQFELWPADKYQQKNGQVTGVRGTYSFLVPPGTYSLKVVAPGYKDYESGNFKVYEGKGVHTNIELRANRWWFKIGDWKIWVIVLLVAGLLYMIEREIKLKKSK
jgi:hypothetical protein